MCLRAVVRVTVRRTVVVTVLFNLHLFHLKTEIESTQFKFLCWLRIVQNGVSSIASALMQADQKRSTTKQQFLIYKAIWCSLQKSTARVRAEQLQNTLSCIPQYFKEEQSSFLFLSNFLQSQLLPQSTQRVVELHHSRRQLSVQPILIGKGKHRSALVPLRGIG